MRLLAVFIVILSIAHNANGQEGDTSRQQGMGRAEIPGLIAKPAFEATNGGHHIKLWIMSVIKDMNEELTNKVAEAVNNGTHHLMVEVSDPMSNKNIPGALVKVLILSPSEKESTVELKPMLNQYGGNLTLDEKGEYQLNVSVMANGEATLTPFKYTVH